MLGKNATDHLRHAARSLAQTPGFTASAVLMLGLAIGGVAGAFSVVSAVLLKPFPFAAPERLVHVAASAPGSQFPPEFGVAPEFLVHYRERATQISAVSTYNSFTNTARLDQRAERIRMSSPTPNLFATLGVQPVLGRLPEETDPTASVVISEALWTDWFARDPDILGRSIEVFGQPRPIIGVMGPEFRFPTDDTLLWVSNRITAADIENPGDFGINLVARLAPGAGFASAREELTALARELPERFGGSANYARLIAQHQAVVRPLDAQLLGRFAQPLWVLLAATTIVLLIACANVGNLFLVRGEARHREMALRRALGAGRSELISLQLSEALIVAMLAAVLALLLAVVVTPLLLQIAPGRLPRIDHVGVDGLTLLCTATAALFAAALCGALPAWRLASPDLQRLRDGGRSATSGQKWLRQALVAAQTALALVLLIGSGLLLRSVWALSDVDTGYVGENVFTFQIAPERAELDSAEAYARFHLRFLQRLQSLPGVQSVGLVENVPINESTASVRVAIDGDDLNADDGSLLNVTNAAGDYFASMRIPLLQGRVFTEQDQTTGSGHLILSRSAAARLWPDQDPIGQRLRRAGEERWETVIGVVGDIRQDGPQSEPQALIYVPLVGPDPARSRPGTSPAYVVRSPRADSIAAEVRALVRELAPEAPMYREFMFEDLREQSMLQVQFTLMTLGLAASLALLLGAMGLHGVLSLLIAAGILMGLLSAALLSRALSGLLLEVEPLDAVTFLGMSMLLAAIGLVASYLPARRACALDPVEALRRD